MFQRPAQIVLQLGEGPRQCALTGNHDIVISGPGAGGRGEPHRFLQSAPRAVAYDGRSKPPGGGETEPGGILLNITTTGPAPRLQHQSARSPCVAFAHAQKACPFLQPADGNGVLAVWHGSAHATPSRPRGSCGPWPCGARGLSSRPWWLCAPGTHAVSCARVRLVDMCVSRLNSMSPPGMSATTSVHRTGSRSAYIKRTIVDLRRLYV